MGLFAPFRGMMLKCKVAKVKMQSCEDEGVKVRKCEGAMAKERHYHRSFAFVFLNVWGLLSFKDNYSFKYGFCGKSSPIYKVYIL